MGSQCYLPPGSGENPAFNPAKAGTLFSDPGGMQGRVDLCYVKSDRPGIEPATCKSQVQRPTTSHNATHLSVNKQDWNAQRQVVKKATNSLGDSSWTDG